MQTPLVLTGKLGRAATWAATLSDKTATREVKNPIPKRVNKKWIKADLARKINMTLCNGRKTKGKPLQEARVPVCCFLGSDPPGSGAAWCLFRSVTVLLWGWLKRRAGEGYLKHEQELGLDGVAEGILSHSLSVLGFQTPKQGDWTANNSKCILFSAHSFNKIYLNQLDFQ